MKLKGLGPSFKKRLNQHPRSILFLAGCAVGAASFYLIEVVTHQVCLQRQLASDNGKSLYTLGQLYARKIEPLRITATEAQILTQGFQDWTANRIARVDFDTHRSSLQTLVDQRQAEHLKISEEEGQAYLKSFVQSGGSVSISGLAYRIVAPGSPKKPTLKDWVEVSYRGTLPSGKLIDSTHSANPKAKFPMTGVIPGWTEGLQMIGEGGEIELVIPANLAYGDAATSADIPPGATLVFRIQLHRVLDAGRVHPMHET